MRRWTMGMALAVLAAPALAQQTDSNLFTVAPTAAGWYGSAGLQVMNYSLPRIGGYQSLFAGAALVRPPLGQFLFNPRADIAMPAATLTFGHVLPPGSLPVWAGQNVRVQVTGMFGGREREEVHENTLGATPFSVLVGLDGRNNNLFLVRPAQSQFANNTSLFGGQLALVSDIPVAAAWRITPSVRLFGSRMRQAFGLDVRERNTLTTLFIDRYDERIVTSRVGLGIGLGVTGDLGGGWSVTAGVSLSAVHTRAEYAGSHCFDNSTGTVGCDGVLGVGSVSQRGSRFGAQLGALLGINFALSPQATISLNGSVDWFSAAPGTTHPFDIAPFPGSAPANIRWGSMLGYGGTMRLTIGM